MVRKGIKRNMGEQGDEQRGDEDIEDAVRADAAKDRLFNPFTIELSIH